MTTTPSPKRRRRRFLQFSLRALLVFVLLVSIGMSWLAVKMQRARRQREAVEAIRKVGGLVGCEPELDDPSVPPVPKWARALLGDDFFCGVVEVLVDSGNFGDEEAIYLKRLTDLQVLSLDQTQITDAGLEHLEGLTKLEWLDLSGTQITDPGLERLEGLTNLDWLRLSETQVTDTGLGHLEGLTKLGWLNLNETQITDAGLEHLEGLTSLHDLDLSGTQVTNGGLEHLKGLANLIRLYVNRTQVTPEGVKKLREVLPECEIVYGPLLPTNHDHHPIPQTPTP